MCPRHGGTFVRLQGALDGLRAIGHTRGVSEYVLMHAREGYRACTRALRQLEEEARSCEDCERRRTADERQWRL